MENELDSSKIFFQKQRYNGKLTLNNLAFNVYLQEFAAQVRHICNLHSRGNLSVEASYKQIDEIWQQLELNYLELGIEDSSSD